MSAITGTHPLAETSAKPTIAIRPWGDDQAALPSSFSRSQMEATGNENGSKMMAEQAIRKGYEGADHRAPLPNPDRGSRKEVGR